MRIECQRASKAGGCAGVKRQASGVAAQPRINPEFLGASDNSKQSSDEFLIQMPAGTGDSRGEKLWTLDD